MNSNPILHRTRVLLSKGGVLGSLLDSLARIYGSRPMVEQAGGIALAGGKAGLTFREAACLTAFGSEEVGRRMDRHRPVVLRGPNGVDLLLAMLAVSRAGGIPIPVNPQMREQEIDYVVQNSNGQILEVSTLIGALRGLDLGQSAWPPAAPDPPRDSTGCILYTSGTTGKPKGAVLTHQGLLELPSATLLWPSALRRDELVEALPVAHVMGLAVLLSAFCSGVPVFSLPRFRPTDVLAAIEARRSSVFVGVPAMYRMMLEAGAEKRDLRSIHLWISAADVLTPDLAQQFKKMGSVVFSRTLNRALGEATFVDGYGMVELSGAVAARISLPFTQGGSGDFLGFPLPPYKLKVVDDTGKEVGVGEVGELAVQGPGVLREYHGNPEATQEVRSADGWLRTGDLMKRERFGLVRFVSRKKEVIKHGGFSVFPAEVETTFREHPAVREVAVVGCPDAVKGEIPVAFVVLEDGCAIGASELSGWAAGRVAEYKTPKWVRLLPALPRTGTGKVARDVLRRAAALPEHPSPR